MHDLGLVTMKLFPLCAEAQHAQNFIIDELVVVHRACMPAGTNTCSERGSNCRAGFIETTEIWLLPTCYGKYWPIVPEIAYLWLQ